MEVFVAILLLFGAFSLGSATSDDADVDPAGLELPKTADVEHTQLRDCLADRHFVIYRNLTVPYGNEIETETTGASDIEEAYPDE